MGYYNRCKKKLLLLDPNNSEFLTTYESISSGKIKILPMLIISDKLILEK